MNLFLFKTIPDVQELLRNPFYKNSLYIALGRFADVGFGFLFWTLAARMYSVGEVGIATALISSLGLVMAFSRLGFDIAIIRFMPSHDHSRVFNTCLGITTMAAIGISVLFLTTIDLISPELTFIKNYTPFFLLFTIVYSVALISENAFLSFRKADLKFIQNLIMGVRLPLLLPFAFLGGMGIFYSFGFAYLAAAVFALIMIQGYVTLAPRIDWRFTRRTFRFSSLNYFASLFQNMPELVMPIFILSLLNPESAALYFVANAIGSLVLIIPDAMSTAFFVEGSHGINLRKGAITALVAICAALIPAIVFVLYFGDFFLGLLGKEYIVAFDLLKVIAMSSIFVTTYKLFIPLQNIRLKVGGIVAINLIRLMLILGLSYVLLTTLGVIGAGYAWAITHVLLSVGIVMIARKRKWV